MVNSENTMGEIVKHVIKAMSFPVWLDCTVQDRKFRLQGCRGMLRLASESHCEHPKHYGNTGWVER